MTQLAKHPPPLQEMHEIQVQSLGWKDFPGEGNGNLLQNSENSTDRGAWQAIVHGAAKSWTQLSTSMMHYSPTGDKYLLHHFIWIKPNKRLVKNKVKIIL